LLIAVTGGTGFVGAALIDKLLTQSHKVRALARDPDKLRRATDLDVVPGDLGDAAALDDLCNGADRVIHCAGLTHAKRDADFTAVNVEGARNIALSAPPAKLIHISSLAARAPHVSAYANSKRESESAVAAANAGAVILRAPAMFGPRDTATLPFFKAVKNGVILAPRATPQPRASILYIDDFVRAICAALDEGAPGALYEIGDASPDGHSWAQIGGACAAAVNPGARLIALPRGVLFPYAAIAGRSSRMLGRAPMVTGDKIREFFHPDWTARENLLADATRWRPQISLKEGFAKTALWYQKHGWL